jgi:hypothetical protein
LSSKSNDNLNNIESDISASTKLNQCSSWSDSIIGEECLSKLRVQDAKIKHPKKNLVIAESSSLPTTQGTIPTHGSICKKHKVPHCVEMPNNPLHCKWKMQFLLNILPQLICMTRNRLLLSITRRWLLQRPLILLLHQCSRFLSLFCDNHATQFIEVVDGFVGLSLMSQEVHHDGTTASVKGQRSDIFQFECKIKDRVCKLIIDGGSFTNVISSDLVSVLSLSMRSLRRRIMCSG